MTKATKQELREELRARWLQGEMLSNIVFNLAQRLPYDSHERRKMEAQVKAWDRIRRVEQ